MTCDKCKTRLAVIKCDRIVKGYNLDCKWVQEVEHLDVCIWCYRKIMGERAMKAMEELDKTRKRGRGKYKRRNHGKKETAQEET